MTTNHPESIDIESLLREVNSVLADPSPHSPMTVRFAQALVLMQTFKMQLLSAMAEAHTHKQYAAAAGAAYTELLGIHEDLIRRTNLQGK